MTSFERLNKRNAKAFFEAYMARKDGVLAEMLRQYTADGHNSSELDYSPQSLVPFWVWMREKMASPIWNIEDVSYDQMPMWYMPIIVNNPYKPTRLSLEAAKLTEMFDCYWGEVLVRNILEMRWGIGDHPGSMGYCEPMVMSEYYSSLIFGVGRIAAYAANEPDNWRRADNTYLDYFNTAVEDEAKYRALYNKLGGHDDPRMAKRVKFD